jgi:hypothetical protein
MRKAFELAFANASLFWYVPQFVDIFSVVLK